MEIYGIAPDWVARCKEWYAKAAFGVIVMKKTIPGHVFNSFLRINLVHGDKLVRNGICSPEDVNQAMRSLGRSFYAGHGFLMTLILIGGDRGMKGGDELVERIKKDAIFLTLFSGMKQNTPLPDCITRSAARLLGRILEGILPDQALETKQVTEQIERAITEDGKIPIQQALLEKSRQIYELTPMEVDNDPFAMTALMK
ncbi:expressed unknown protein [Seminavis robusta]|uniref:Uncharacterized protein n=1 Tax=Seminavis robusta TaxID=568900 RepID=A0A9N8DMF5_9STRA|nr:expressed unknown protein [Seminavis robusta]|eukprot:Sro224_g091600.1 n/a (199) ;mRNA; r:31474-32070